MKHVFSVIGVCCALLFVAVFFTGRLEAKHLALVAPRVGMHVDELGVLGLRIASQTGATVGTSRRVVYLLACSGMPDRATMEQQAREAASVSKARSLTAREAAVLVLSGKPQEGPASPLKDC